MMPVFVLLGAILVGSLYWLWVHALVDRGLAAVATGLCTGAIGALGIAMVLAATG
jgi:hypothetical protein